MKKWRQNLVFLGICCALLLSPLQAQAISCPPTETWGKGNTYISVQEEKGVCPSTSTYRELSNTCNNDNTQIQTPSFFSKVFSFYLTLLQNNLPIFQYNDKASSVKVAPMPRSMQEMKQNEINTPYVQQVVDLVNQERVKEGLQELTLDPTLTAAAEIRAKEIVELFSHTRQTVVVALQL